MNKDHIGGSFDDFLKEEGIFEEVTIEAQRRQIDMLTRALKMACVLLAEYLAHDADAIGNILVAEAAHHMFKERDQ